jgi:hypothetical protein
LNPGSGSDYPGFVFDLLTNPGLPKLNPGFFYSARFSSKISLHGANPMRWLLTVGCVLASLATAVAAEDEFTLSKAGKLSDGYGEKIAAALDPQGTVIAGKDGPVCTIWLAKSLMVKPGFKPSLTVKYPLAPGQLLGALQVQSGEFSDFRGQPVKAGLYTLRYGQQPQDGNHVGTSELSDFLLAVPAASDTDPAPVKVPALMKRSAKATGSNHPAIYSLLPPEEKSDETKLTHDAAKELWILNVTGKSESGAKVPLRLVVVGKSEG